MTEATAHTPGPWKVIEQDWAPWSGSIGVGKSPEEILFWTTRGLGNEETNARLIAAAPDMLAALHNVQKIISEGAMTGFNCHDGDWAERLFTSQQVTSAAADKAEGRP